MKLNKKLLAAASVVAVLSSTTIASAKTEGNYVGLDLLRSHATHKYKGNYQYTATISDTTEGQTFEDAGNGLGLNYRHAINFDNGVFVAPGVFLELNNTKAAGNEGDDVKIKSRRGVKFDVGYDVDPQLSVYATTGLASVVYDAQNYFESGGTTASGKKSASAGGLFYGVGLVHNCTKTMATNLEFTTQTVDLAAPFGNKIKTDLTVIKLGASYRF